MKDHNFRIGTLNVQGGNQPAKKQSLAEDMRSYKCDAILLTETRIRGRKQEEEISTIDGKTKFNLITVGLDAATRYGVGIIIKKDIIHDFEEVNDRICRTTIKMQNNRPNIDLVCAYAPTLPKSEKDNKIRDNFYETLSSVINKVPQRNLLLLAGDFNAQTGTGHKNNPDIIGKFGRDRLNPNGAYFIEFLRRHNLIATNTFFQQKKAHITTWQSSKIGKDGNPTRRQLDYICTRKEHQSIIQNSR